jgi:hypothetical protein
MVHLDDSAMLKISAINGFQYDICPCMYGLLMMQLISCRERRKKRGKKSDRKRTYLTGK